MAFSLSVEQYQFSYEADFSPPVFDLAVPEKRAGFLKIFSSAFNLKAADIVFNPHNLSRGEVFVRKWVAEVGTFDISIGYDGCSLNVWAPVNPRVWWAPVNKLLTALSDSAEIRCEKQVLKFQAHGKLPGIKTDEYIAKFNVFESEVVSSKGATFAFRGPQPNSQIFFVLAKSLVVPEGIFLLSEVSYVQEAFLTPDLYESCANYLQNTILSLLGLELNVP